MALWSLFSFFTGGYLFKMTDRKKYSSGAKWEAIVGYSRAIRIGDIIEVSGTCAVDDQGNAYAPGDPYLQTRQILEIISRAITNLGGTMEHVVRTRIFVTNMTHWEAVGKAHGETFHAIRPVTTMVEVSKLISPEYLVEIEATAIITHT